MFQTLTAHIREVRLLERSHPAPDSGGRLRRVVDVAHHGHAPSGAMRDVAGTFERAKPLLPGPRRPFFKGARPCRGSPMVRLGKTGISAVSCNVFDDTCHPVSNHGV